jgi:AcrR family transcriptional regulator
MGLSDEHRGSAPGSLTTQAEIYNLNGQRLGRKGKDTRDRIIAAAEKILAGPPSTQITLSAVAREASLKMTTLYLYFKDLTELLLATLEPVMATAEESYMSLAQDRWQDDELYDRCLRFVSAYLAFWKKHSFILHLRNSMADQLDRRMMLHRLDAAQSMITLLVKQMDCDPPDIETPAHSMATVMLTGLERLVTIQTDTVFLPSLLDGKMVSEQVHNRRIEAEAKLLELGIRELRNRHDDVNGRGPARPGAGHG